MSFRMPAEWEPHDGCWLAWPENTYVWRDGAKPAQRALATIADAIAAAGEQVTVTCSPAQYLHARSRLTAAVRVLETTTSNAWARDVGPTFVVDDDGRRSGVDWTFNGYGGRSPGWLTDVHYARKVLDAERCDRYTSPPVLEGGAIHVNGEGTCLTTAECLLHENRNPGRDRAEIERLLADALGVREVIWLPSGLPFDETNGHVDNIACFTGPDVVCLSWTDDVDDPQYERSQAAWEVLTGSVDVVRLPMPGPLYVTDDETGTDVGVRPGTRLPASYVNHYVANRAVVMPAFGVDTDTEAEAILAALYPDREIVALPTREILLGGGNIHCTTQQVPHAPRR